MEEATLTEAPRQPSRWERFTPKLQQAIYMAQERAAAAGLREVQPEHLLEGLLAGADTIPPWVVASLDVDLEPLRRGMAALPATERPTPELRLSARMLDVLALAEWEARELNDLCVGTSHALLALLDVASPAAECLWRWRMTRLELYQWLTERTGEERLDAAPANWEYAPLEAAPDPGTIADPSRSPPMSIADTLPLWLILRAVWGFIQLLWGAKLTFDDFLRLPHPLWLALWTAEGLWNMAGASLCVAALHYSGRRAWARTFAFMYVQCAVLTVAGITCPPMPTGIWFIPPLRSMLEFLLFTGLLITTRFYFRRTEFGVGEREGWRAMYREAGWLLAMGALLGAAGLLAWPLARGQW